MTRNLQAVAEQMKQHPLWNVNRTERRKLVFGSRKRCVRKLTNRRLNRHES